MTQSIENLSWGQRFALIDYYKLDDDKVCTVFKVAQRDLDAARSLVERHMITVDHSFPVAAFRNVFDDSADEPPVKTLPRSTGFASLVGQLLGEAPNVQKTGTPGRVHKISGTSNSTGTQPKTRGRRGTRIAEAFLAIPTEPVSLDAFLATHNVSVNVLRQSRRFDTTGRGPVNIKKIDGQHMIWRAPLDTKPTE